MNILIKNIKGLVQVTGEEPLPKKGRQMNRLKVLENAYLFIKDGKIADFGLMDERPSVVAREEDASGRYVFPSYVDSHTHLVFAGSREKEFVMRLQGKSYEEIAAEGGGILNSARLLRDTSEEALFESAKTRLDEIIRLGTGAVEIKSGYGLTLESELKMLRVIREVKKVSPVPVKATFLGAHALPAEYRDKRDAYVDLVVSEMLPEVAGGDLAEYIDVFCDRGFFTREETGRILKAGAEYGLKPKIHANELDFTGGIQEGVKYGAVSVDHLECTGDEEINVLRNSNTMPTVLPATAFFLGMEYPPARKFIDSGLPVSIASDYNPGSCPSGNMSLVTALACIKLKMTPEEAINAATVNSACAVEMEKTHGSIRKGAPANIFITREIPSYAYLPYAFGSYLVDKVILNGKEYQGIT